MPVRIGTRGSRLALAQAERVASLLRSCGTAPEIVIITTKGDTVDGVPLHEIGGQGVFVRALDDAILDGRIDAAVHSMKAIPAKRPDGLRTCAILKRDSPADFLVHTIPREEIRVIGTTSTRRRAQLLRHMEGVLVKQLRGNVDTRLRKLVEGQYDAIVIAEAGLERMGLSVSGTRLSPQRFVPSPNQGTIAVVCRGDPTLCEVFAPLDHTQTRIDVEMERMVMEEVGGGCFTPQGIYAHYGHLIGEILSLDGTRRIRREDDVGSLEDARTFGQYLRKEGEELIREAYEKLRICDEG